MNTSHHSPPRRRALISRAIPGICAAIICAGGFSVLRGIGAAGAQTPVVQSPVAKPMMNQSGGRLAFASNRNGDYDIFVMNANGTGLQRVSKNKAHDGNPSWSADGRRLAFDSNRDIFVIDADGENQRHLTEDKKGNLSPAFSPDGGRIAWVSARGGSDDIWTMNVAPSAAQTGPVEPNRMRRLTSHAAKDLDPAWSANGRRIAWESNRAGNYDIYVMDANGANARRLTRHKADDHDPAFSPDGRTIAFTSYRSGNREVFLMNADGSNVRRLTRSRADDYNPTFSPDGRRIAWESNLGPSLRRSNFEIFVMNRDGSRPVRLTNHPRNDYEPAWAPR